ncbi:MAG: APC family permease, partial [Candidatus Dormibacteraeota bacterium]|nr:APC family permease [Candidatus Dormibacteraeota bacterium]
TSRRRHPPAGIRRTGLSLPPTATSRPGAPTKTGGQAGRLGFFLCWTVVFADIGTSVYYTPGILYGTVGQHAALFVAMTLVVFILLTVKYAEVATRYPEGGGVVTVATRAIHPIAGLIGGLFILVDYFLTSALSALSGLIYLSVLLPQIKSQVVLLTVAALAVLGAINILGAKASAQISAVFAVAAAIGQAAVVAAVIWHLGLAKALGTVPVALQGRPLTPILLITGFAGAFLAFSGLESIAQLAPSMAEPRQKVARTAMILVVVTIGLTSPLLTLWSTTLLDAKHADPNQFVSLLGGYAGGWWLQDAVAITASLLLVFASNTALLGAYHVLLALGRMRFLPAALLAENRWSHTPQWAILASTAIPVAVVLFSRGDVNLLGDLYAFGLLGAFTLTCVSLDFVRWHERSEPKSSAWPGPVGRTMFVLGLLTTVAVGFAWTVNLYFKPLATLFGGGLTILGLALAGLNYLWHRRGGRRLVFPYHHRHQHPVMLLGSGRRMPAAAVLAVLPEDRAQIPNLLMRAAEESRGRPVAYLWVSPREQPAREHRLFEVRDPYLHDEGAQDAFELADASARENHIPARYLYIAAPADPGAVEWVEKSLRPIRVLTAPAADHGKK